MARNRQRAKQRAARRRAGGSTEAGAAGAAPQVGADAPVDRDDAAAANAVNGGAVTKTDAAKPTAAKPTAKRGPTEGAAASNQRRRFGGRTIGFLKASANELRRVQWPDRAQVTTMSGIVLGFVVIAGTYLGLLDAGFSRLIDQIIF